MTCRVFIWARESDGKPWQEKIASPPQFERSIAEVFSPLSHTALQEVESTTGAVALGQWGVTVSRWLSQYRHLTPRHSFVSSRRSSNRTCGSPASGSPTRSCLRPRKARRSQCKTSPPQVFPQALVREAHVSSRSHAWETTSFFFLPSPLIHNPPTSDNAR